MRDLLFLAHRFPYPPDKGEKIRSWNLIRHLAQSWRVHLGCLSDNPDDLRHMDAVRARGKSPFLKSSDHLAIDHYGYSVNQSIVRLPCSSKQSFSCHLS